ncbi:hypothetical protein GGQ85_000023 [Nitrobacter vulgaris]|nr:hypothetical protein [Nitrobacter vulgaris]
MASPNDNPPRGVVLVMLLSLSVFTGRGTPPKSGESAPNSPAQTQPQR